MSLANYNYIEYLNNFYKLAENKQITSKAQCLYNVLLHCFNKSFWQEELELTTRYLLKISALNNKVFYSAREELHILKLIEYHSKKGRTATIYKLIKQTTQETLQKANINYIPQNVQEFVNNSSNKYKSIGNFVLETLNTACNDTNSYTFKNQTKTNNDFIKLTKSITCDDVAKLCTILANSNTIKNPKFYVIGYFVNSSNN